MQAITADTLNSTVAWITVWESLRYFLELDVLKIWFKIFSKLTHPFFKV